MSKQIIADQAPQFPLPFSHALRSGDFVHVSGQVGVIPETREIAGTTIQEQTAQCIRNVEIVLQAAGLTLDHVVKVNAYVSRQEDIPGYNEAYRTLFAEPYPARTTIQCGVGAYLVEIDVVAYAPAVRGR